MDTMQWKTCGMMIMMVLFSIIWGSCWSVPCTNHPLLKKHTHQLWGSKSQLRSVLSSGHCSLASEAMHSVRGSRKCGGRVSLYSNKTLLPAGGRHRGVQPRCPSSQSLSVVGDPCSLHDIESLIEDVIDRASRSESLPQCPNRINALAAARAAVVVVGGACLVGGRRSCRADR